MRILSPGIITKEEDVFITSLKSTFNSNNIEKIFKDQYNLSWISGADCKEGDIVVYNEQIAFKLGFEVKVAFAILIDRSGHFVGISDCDNSGLSEAEPSDPQVNLMQSDFIKRCENEITAAIAASLEKETLQELFEKEFKLNMNGNPEFNKGSIVAHENNVVYKLEYDTQLLFNLLIDRAGNYLGPGKQEASEDKLEEEATATDDYSPVSTSVGSGTSHF